MLPLLAPILTQLAGAGLHKVVDSVLDKGVDYVQDKLGIDLTPDDGEGLSSSKLESIKVEAMKHEEFMFAKEVEDKQDSRKMYMAMANKPNAHWLERLLVPILAIGIVTIALALVGAIMFINIPDSQENIVIFALGFITAAAGQVISFYFGSSQGSKDKTEELMNLKK